MSLLNQPSILDSATLAGAEAAHHMASVLRSQWELFWNRDSEIIFDEIGADLQKTLAIFTLNTQAGTSINALLDAIGDDRFSKRAPVSLPANWSFDGSTFSYNPPVEQ